MLFNSIDFLILFILTFTVYYLKPLKKFQVYILIASSLIFYAYSQPNLLILLISSITINSAISHAIVYRTSTDRKLLAVLGVILNLSLIIYFKYSGMLSRSFGFDTTDIGQFLISLPLPLGISFFTFEGISLVVDTFKEENRSTHHPFVERPFLSHLSKSFLFVSFFPHLIAGPILKAHEFYPQISGKLFKNIPWDTAFKQLLTGYFLKMVIADNLKDQTFWIAYPYFLNTSSETLVTMLFGYSIQIFADFAGYSLIALGLATLLGYELKGNFNHPYISTSFSEFWRRWHISLSSFLREYLYIPLGGNRKGKFRTYFNLLLTMFLGGLWHGAAWSYAIWGLTHGILLASERLINDHTTIKSGPIFRFFKLILVFSMVTLAWLLFKLPEFSHVIAYLEAIGNNMDLTAEIKRNMIILVYSLPVIFYSLIGYLNEKNETNFLMKNEWLLYGVLIFLLVTNSGSSADFIYFQF